MDKAYRTIASAALVAMALLAGMSGFAEAQRPAGCGTDKKLLPTHIGADLVIKGECTVETAGIYMFRNVNIIAGGVLRFTDATIDFWAANILVESGGSLIAGSPGEPIGTNGVVTIHLYGEDQTDQNPRKPGKGITCLSDPERCGVPKDIWESNIEAHKILPPDAAQKISQQTSAKDYLGVTDDYFYPYHPLPHDGADMQGYFGYKVLAVSYGGTLQLFGKRGATYGPLGECGETAPSASGTSWARLNATAQKDTKTLTVDRKLSLRAGDQIVVTTTDYLPGHSEQLTVAGDVTCGTSIAVKEPLKYSHVGSRYSLSAVRDGVLDPALKSAGAETRAAVALLTRSIRIVSAGDTKDQNFPEESTGYFFGGHLVARQGFKTFQVQGVEFYQMGQGGRLGHYPVHFHHARKTPPDTFVKDSSIHDSMTRWIVLHGTQDVTLERNVGYKSIGHGFYLEDGTEINNTLRANLGIFARAAVDNIQNPRKVPGILAAPDLRDTGEDIPFRSDYDHPTLFWIMNGWNDFQDNMAAGAGTCGVCYWLVPGFNSGPSQGLKWESYASMQSNKDRAATTPLKSFVGNSCTAAMTSFQVVGKTEACLGVGPAGPFPTLHPIKNPLAANTGNFDYYPHVDEGGGRFPTQCGGPGADPHADCSNSPPRCDGNNPAACMVTVLDRYTTSFNWAAFNFAAIWLRPQWYLMSNSVVTDAQQAGLTMVTGGGYSAADVIPGHWALVQKSVFIGHTQEDNPLASNGGPFNPQSGLRCAQNAQLDRPGNYCLSIDEGVSHQMSNFGMYQRLFSVYDGPAYQESNAYLNIKPRRIDDCSPVVSGAPDGNCDPADKSQFRQSAWLAGYVRGLPKGYKNPQQPKEDEAFCYMPNAAIGWKQPNGFYYAPAFHSANLFFKDVDIRHFVLTPLHQKGSFSTDPDLVKNEYCNWGRDLFNSFTHIDRQTVLNDDDGTLTGYKGTTVINLDEFFHAPVQAIQCQSDMTSVTSPYQYVTTVVYPRCVVDRNCGGDWDQDCSTPGCYGVPMYRQDLLPDLDQGVAKSIRMMGQKTGQRSTLTVNHGTYYMDTAVDSAVNQNSNLFRENQTYYLFLIFATDTTEQTYQFYVGENTSFDPASIQMVQADIRQNPVGFKIAQPLPPGRARWLNNDKATAKGVVEVLLKVSDLPDVATKIKTATKDKCLPATYCSWNAATNTCVDAKGSDAACRWSGAHPDCPDGGCIGIVFTLPAGFATLKVPATVRPAAVCLPKAAPWDVSFEAITVSDGVCPNPLDTLPMDFCK